MGTVKNDTSIKRMVKLKRFILMNFRVVNGPSYGKAIASSENFCAYIGAAANRLEFFEFSERNVQILYAADAVITDMGFVPSSPNKLITASRDQCVSENCKNNLKFSFGHLWFLLV